MPVASGHADPDRYRFPRLPRSTRPGSAPAASTTSRPSSRTTPPPPPHTAVHADGAPPPRVRHEAVRPRREVADATERRAADCRRVEDRHVGGESGHESAAISDSEHFGGLRRQAAYALLER